jgi:hypothetical protein
MKTKEHCIGCYNNVYNNHDFGMNMKNGKPECWSLPDAKMVKAMDIPTMMPPPYKNFPIVSRPSCYKAKGYSRVKKESLTKEGYWK